MNGETLLGRLAGVLLRMMVASATLWLGSHVIHEAMGQVPSLPFPAAMGVIVTFRALIYAAGDLIRETGRT